MYVWKSLDVICLICPTAVDWVQCALGNLYRSKYSKFTQTNNKFRCRLVHRKRINILKVFSCSICYSKRVIKVPKKSLDHTFQPHHCMSCVLRIRIPSRYLQWRWRVMNRRNGFKQNWHRNAMTFLKVMPQCKFADALPTHFVVMEYLSLFFYVYKFLL